MTSFAASSMIAALATPGLHASARPHTVTSSALAARINRRASREYQHGRVDFTRVCRSTERERDTLGEWHAVNDRDLVVLVNVDLETVAQTLNVLAPGEHLAR